MTQQVINIGIQGNDGTGDSIRESFTKVNNNFSELYAIFGAGGTIKFTNLADAPHTYSANQLIMSSTTGHALTARSLIAGAGITIEGTTSNPNNGAITISAATASRLDGVSLGTSLDAATFTIGRLNDPSQALVESFNTIFGQRGVTTSLDQLPVTVGYNKVNFVSGVATTEIVDGIITPTSYQLQVPVKPRAEPAIPETSAADYDETLTGNYLSTEAMQRKDVVYRGGDTMTGKLTLSDHPTPLNGAGIVHTSEDLQAATKYYVDSNTYYSGTNLYVSATKGDDLQSNTPVGREGRGWQYAYKTVGAAALQAENLIDLSTTEPGPYRQTIAYTIGPTQTPSTIQSITLSGGNSGNTAYTSAATLLESNRTFIQSETVAYVNKKYVNTFTFDKARYSSIIENLLSGISYDIALTNLQPTLTTYNATTQASILFNAYNSDLISTQLAQLLDGINFAKEQLMNFSYNTFNLETYVGDVIAALCYDMAFGSNFQTIMIALAFPKAQTNLDLAEITGVLTQLKESIITIPSVVVSTTAVDSIKTNVDLLINILETGDIPTPSFPPLVSTSVGLQSAANLLINNIPFIQAEIIAFLVANFPALSVLALNSTVVSNKEICQRDVKYITWSLVYDLLYGGNSQTSYVAGQYYAGNVLQIAGVELEPTIAAVEYLGTLAQSIIANETPDILYQESIVQYANGTLTGGSVASTNISDHIANMLNIISTGNGASVVQPTITDAPQVLQTARVAVVAESATYESNSLVYIGQHFDVINNETINQNIDTLFTIVTDLLTNGTGARVTPTFTNPSTILDGFVAAQAAIIANIGFITAETNQWLIINAGVSFDQDKSIRDITYLLEAVCYDITFGGNSATTAAAKQFWANATTNIPTLQTICSNAIQYAQNLATQVAVNTQVSGLLSSTPQVRNSAWANQNGQAGAVSAIDALFNEVRNIVNNFNNIVNYPLTYPTLSSFDPTVQSTFNIIQNNLASISESVNNSLSAKYTGGFSYNQSTCFRDVGFIVDAMTIDLLTGGTYQSVAAGKAYYRNASALAVAIGTQNTETIDALVFAQTVANQVMKQETATRYQTDVTQTPYNSSLADSGIQTAIDRFNSNYQIILTIINDGIGNAPTPDFGTGLYTITFTNGGNGFVDQGRTNDVHIIPGKILIGNTSGASAQIVSYVSGVSNNTLNDVMTVRMVKPGFFQLNESMDFGETVSNLQITIMVESGVYYEDYPIRIPANVTIQGDDFRRTIIRPLNRASQSPWRKIFFYRDSVIDSLQIGLVNYNDVDYAVALNTTAAISGITGEITISLGSGIASSQLIGKIFTDATSDTGTAGKAIVNTISGNVLNCTVIYPFAAVTNYSIGTWHLYSTIDYGRHYLTDPLDVSSIPKNNKKIDVFLCNDATRIRLLTLQGHGGFGMVLDPEGQIKTKSPYAQEAASFIASANRVTFAGGQFVDGFAGRLQGTITAVENNGITITVTGTPNSGLDIRAPQVPCSFFVQGSRYQVNDVVSYDSVSMTVQLTLDVSTPFDPSTAYNPVAFKSQMGNIINAVSYDMVFGSNYQSIRAGLRYLLPQNAIGGLGLALVTQGINSANTTIDALGVINANQTTIANNLDIITNIMNYGTTVIPTALFPTPVTLLSTSPQVCAKALLQANRAFIQQEITAWIANNYIISEIPNYSAIKSQRDVGILVDSVTYDVLYGGNSMSYDAALAFQTGAINLGGSVDVCVAAYNHLKSVMKQIVVGTPITPYPSAGSGKAPGNSLIQITNLSFATSAEVTRIDTLMTLVTTYVDTGVFPGGTSYTYPDISGQPLILRTDFNIIEADVQTIEDNAVNFVNNGSSISINIEMAGNRSMLSSHFTQVNDLGYAVIATNGGVSEQVSGFTYYCHTGYWALNGGQIRSVSGSSAYGNYGLRASGYNPTEMPDAVSMVNDMVQTARIYKEAQTASSMIPTVSTQALILYIIGWDYIPYNGSEIEIDHTLAGGGFTRYLVGSVQHTAITINGQNVLQISLSTKGSNNTSTSGLQYALYDGQLITIRALYNVKFNGVVNTAPTVASTALQYNIDLATIYRLVAYNLTESTGEAFSDSSTVILQSDSTFNYQLITTDTTKLTQLDPTDSTKTQGSKVGDNKIAVLTISTQNIIAQINTGTFIFGWNGRVHRVLGYTPPTFLATADVANQSTTLLSSTAGGLLTLDSSARILVGAPIVFTQVTQTPTVTATSATGNRVVLSSLTNLVVNETIVFTAVTQGGAGFTATHTYAGTNYVTVTSTTNMIPGEQIVFSGVGFGNILNSFTYYITSVVNDHTITINTSYGVDGETFALSEATGSMTYTAGGSLGGLIPGTTYYIVAKDSGTSSISISTTLGGPAVAVTAGKGAWTAVAGGTLGGVVSNGTYYVASNNTVTNQITVSTTLNGAAITSFTTGAGKWTAVAGGNTSSSTIVVNNVAGTIANDVVITGAGFTQGQRVVSSTTTVTNSGSLTLVVLNNPPDGTPSGSLTFGVTINGYLSIDPNPVLNNAATGTTIPALTYVSSEMGTDVTTNEYVTYNIPYSTTLPNVDSFITVANQANTTYNGTQQVSATTSQTTVNVTSVTNLVPGMLIASTSVGAVIPANCIVQSVTTGQFVVSPAAWLPVGSVITGIFPTTLASISVAGGTGAGYSALNPPRITITGGGATTQATAVAVINDSGVIIGVSIITPGSGYTSTPDVAITPGSSGTAVLTAHLTQATNYTSDPILSSSNATQVTLVYTVPPTGNFTFGTALTVTGTPSSSGTGPYSLTFAFTSTTAPTIGAYFVVAGNSNSLFNGTWVCTNSSATSITLTYPHNPGTWGTGATTITKEVTSSTSDQLGISRPFDPVTSTALRLGYSASAAGQITLNISTTRATSHDFLNIGTGGYTTSNYPNVIYGPPALPINGSQQVLEETVGRVFYVSTDQDGIFRVGRFFEVNQGTGTVTFSESIALSNLDGLGFKQGVVVNKFTTDSTLIGDSPTSVPVESAIRGFVDSRLGLTYGGTPVASTDLIGPGYLALNGTLGMKGNINMAGNNIQQLAAPANPSDATNKSYVDTQVTNINSLNKLKDTAATMASTVSNTQCLVYDSSVTNNGSTTGSWKNTAQPTGDVNTTYNSVSGLTTSIQANKIYDSMVNVAAAIQQSKLAMVTSPVWASAPTGAAVTAGAFVIGKRYVITTVGSTSWTTIGASANTVGVSFVATGVGTGTGTATEDVQANIGLASFNSNAFTTTRGWVDLQTSSSSSTGVLLTKIQQLASGTILGNRTPDAASPTQITPVNVVTDGNGISNASFTSAGVLTLTSYADATVNGVVNTGGANQYAITNVTTARAANSIVKTGSDGSIDAANLKIAGVKAIDAAGTLLSFITQGGFTYLTVSGTTGSNTTTSTFGLLDTSGGTLQATQLTTGGATTQGTLTGLWKLAASSVLDLNTNNTTLKAFNITTDGTDTGPGTIQGAWTLTGASKLQATYADLAEWYSADAEYAPGTVLVFGGDAEVTTSVTMNDTRCAGVVTTDPAYIMNQDLKGTRACIALAGRVPCKVVGRVKKGDMLTTSATAGYAVKALNPTLGAIIGKALEDKDYGEAGVIQIAVGRA